MIVAGGLFAEGVPVRHMGTPVKVTPANPGHAAAITVREQAEPPPPPPDKPDPAPNPSPPPKQPSPSPSPAIVPVIVEHRHLVEVKDDDDDKEIGYELPVRGGGVSTYSVKHARRPSRPTATRSRGLDRKRNAFSRKNFLGGIPNRL